MVRENAGPAEGGGRAPELYARSNRFMHFSTYQIDPRVWQLQSLTYADVIQLVRVTNGQGTKTAWQASHGWSREFGVAGESKDDKYGSFDTRAIPLETPSYFKTENLEAGRMTYGQLRGYISQLQTSGFNAIPQMVELQRKVAFPLVTLVMTLLAVPFAVTTGRRGALYGVGAGIVLAIVYWITLSIFAAMGAGGLVAPLFAAWAPNILFSAAAAYLILTVRT